MKNITCADLFCGGGGLSIGLQRAGFRPKYSVDIWNVAKNNHENSKYLNSSKFLQYDLLNDEDRQKLIDTLNEDRVFLLAGGPPCQGFSTMGKRRANDKRNGLVDAFLDVIKNTNPNVVLIENVTGLKSMKHEQTGLRYPEYIKIFLKDLQPGYEVASVLLDGTEYGLAQTRKRVFFICVRKDIWKNKSLDEYEEVVLETINKYKVKEKKVLKDIIYDLPRLESGQGEEEIEFNGKKIYNHNVFEYSDLVLKRMSFVKSGGGLMDIPIEYLPDHLKKVMNGEYGSGGLQKNVYGRLEWDKPCGTVLAGIRKITCGRFFHPENDRLLTVRECARLQGFPEDYKFLGSMTEQYTIVGNAVPPVFGEVLGKSIIDILDL